MEKAELQPCFVARSETQNGRHGKIERAALALQFRGGQIAPGQLNPVHRDDFDAERGLARQPRFSRPAAKAQPIGAGAQLPIRSKQQAARRLSAAHGSNSGSAAAADRGLFETREHRPVRRLLL